MPAARRPTLGLLLLALAAAAAAEGPAVTVTPQVLADTRAPVTVAWSGVGSPGPHDVVEAVLVTQASDAPGAAEVVLGFFNATESPTWAQGRGSRPVALFNPRWGGYVFRYRRGPYNAPSLPEQPGALPPGQKPPPPPPPLKPEPPALAESAAVTYAEPNEPTGVHLALTSAAGEMRVTWSVRDALAGQAAVQFGLSPSDLNETRQASAHTYSRADMCGLPANLTEAYISPGHFQTAVMDGLPAGRRVYYRVGAAGGAAPWSAVFSFTAAPEVAAATETVLVAYGDMGTRLPLNTGEEQQPAALKTAALVARDVEEAADAGLPAAVVHIGDISYSRGHAKYQNHFMQLIEPVAAAAPYHVSIGNHEYDFPATQDPPFSPWRPKWAGYGTDSGGECGVVMFKTWQMPDAGFSGGSDVAYSFDFGNIHMTVFSAEHDFLPGSEQYQFLEADLAAVDRSRTPWLIVGTHRPMYSSAGAHTIAADHPLGFFDDHLRGALEPLVAKYRADLFLAGHVHTYERQCGFLTNFECAPTDSEGTVHILTGAGGNDYNPNWEPSQPGSPPDMNNNTDWSDRHHAQPDWSVFRTMNNGYTRFRTNETHLVMQFVGDQRGGVHDELVMTRKSF